MEGACISPYSRTFLVIIYKLGQYMKNNKIVSHSQLLSLDLFLFILFYYIDFGDMFRHQVPSSGRC
jgi:hypothetical protein